MVLSQLTIILCTVMLTGFAAQLPAPFKQCAPVSSGEIRKVTVNSPCTKEHCTFYKGKDARLEFTFTLKKKAHKVRAKVMATIGTMEHEFALPNPDACQQLGCPLQNGVPYTYHNSMFVSLTYPSVKVNQMRYYLIDGKGRELACVAFPVMITEEDSKQ